MIRLNKFLQQAGLCSRRAADDLIREGRVSVDGRTAQLGEKVGAEAKVTLDGAPVVRHPVERIVIALNKPAGIVCTEDKREPDNVIDFLHYPERITYAGRLDKNSEGLLLMTNDGEFAHRVISPKSCVEKRYYADIDGEVDAVDIAAFAEGMTLADGTRCRPAKLEILGEDSCLVTVTEGKYHQVKRMLASRGKPVLELRRLAIGELKIDESLGPGGCRELTENDLCKLLCELNLGN
ncbi:MAG: rRNA pseudouridine synthase [Oscillospiraceae bacterium]|nr:rRNA pseudouridine synthase [Oscillospiraceae bacterium]